MRKKLIVVLIAVLMLLVVSVPNALAYFTTYARVQGSSALHLKEQVGFDEGSSEDGHKLITLTIADDSDDVYVRVKALAVKAVLDNMTYKEDGDWTEENDGDNCKVYTYKGVLTTDPDGVQSVTLELIVDADAVGMDEFNVVVVYEYCPVTGDTPDWNIHIPQDGSQNGGGE